jgi:hypothetical protein
MADTITPFSIPAPGFFGLNTQDAPITLDPNYALDATNCIIDKYGRIGSRKGWAKAHTSNSDLSTGNVTCIGEVTQNDGTTTVVAAGNGYLFKLSSTTLTTLTYGGGGVAPTIAANNWQFIQQNGIGIFFQRGYDPLIFDPGVSTTQFRRLSEKSGYTGTVPQANCALSAYGRVWCADTSSDKNTVSWSDIIAPQLWTAGTSGSLNLVGVWPKGGDEVVALAAHNNNLIIFGKKQTLIYAGATDPATMELEDVLVNVGCIARDSVQNTGDDVIFLSDVGVMSLARTIQEKSAPMRGLSKNIYNDIQLYISAETLANVKSGYSPTDAMYVITFPSNSLSYCFDMRGALQDGASRVTLWTGINPKCFMYSRSKKFYFGKAGYIGEYSTYYDDATSYLMSYYTPWIDFGNPILTSILKKIIMTLIGSASQAVTFRWGADFVSNSGAGTVTVASGSVAEYGTAEYGIGEYQAGEIAKSVGMPAGGSGKVLQVGFEARIQGSAISIQKIDIFTKDGRL